MEKNFSKIITGIAVCAVSTAALANSDNLSSNKSYAKPGLSFGIDGGYGYISSPEPTYPNNYTYDDEYKYTSTNDTGDYVWGVHVAYDFKIKPNLLMGFELGYKDLGSSTNDLAYYKNVLVKTKTTNLEGYDDEFALSREYQQNAVDFLLTTHIYLYQGLNIFAKAGAAYVRSDITQNASATISQYNPPSAPTIDTNGLYNALNGDNEIWRIEPEVSFGIGYMFNNNVDIHAAYTYIGGSDDQPIIGNNSYTQEAKGTTVIVPNYGKYNQPTAKVYSTNMLTLGISYTF